jgi:anti-anti-sigma factor
VVSTTIAETKVLGNLTVVSWRAAAEVAVLYVVGEVDLLTVQVFRDTVDQVLDRPPLVLVIDLSAVTFFGASGLTVLVVARELAQQRGAALRLVCGTRAVTRPLALVGLDHSFETYHDLETGLSTDGWLGFAGSSRATSPTAALTALGPSCIRPGMRLNAVGRGGAGPAG